MISVITPCINIRKNYRDRWFHEMMRKTHEQSYKDIEHIVIDGASEDGTMDILKYYKEIGWIDKLISEKDSGIYDAVNKGLKIAKGKYINIMNTDDYFLDMDYLKRAVEVIEKDDYDFVHADKIIKPSDEGKGFVKRGNELSAFFRMPFRHQTMVVKREVFDDIGFFDKKYEIASDYKWTIKLLLANKKGYHFRENVLHSLAGGVSSDRKKCIDEVSAVIFESYGERLGFSQEDCRKIYLRKFSVNFCLKTCF